MRLTYGCIALSLLLLQNYASAQQKLNIKFGKVSAADFDLTKSTFDTAAAAVVIADIGSTSFEGNGKMYFTLVYTRYKRIKILKKSGFDAASDEIEVYSDGQDEERLSDLKAITYNLENGQVTQTKLDDKSIFTDKIDKHRSLKKFTLPAVKEGSIVEITYTIKSDFYQFLRSWKFEGEYPRLWSEYNIEVPDFFHYMKVTQGDQSFFIDTVSSRKVSYSVRESGGATTNDEFYEVNSFAAVERWVKRDVPAFRPESYLTTPENYESKVSFQLHYIQFTETSERHNYLTDWYVATDKLLKDEQFGGALNDDNGWMGDALKTLTDGSTTDLERTQKIYAYLRDNFTCTDHDVLFTHGSLKAVFKAKSGNVAEINLLLTAMLRHEKIISDPVILSTRDHGFASETYPMIENFNYVICAATVDSKAYYLDASRPDLGFGQIPSYCYNGAARTVNHEKPFIVYLSADSIRESKTSSVVIINDEKGFPSGTYQSLLSKDESYDMRVDVRKNGQKSYFKSLQTRFGSEIQMDQPQGIDSVSKTEFPVKIYYDFNLKSLFDGDVVYFNPMAFRSMQENPLAAADRKYPVEMPYTFTDTYVFNMEIPTGYVVDELPQSARVNLNENEGSFEYLIQKTESSIQMRSKISFNKANFTNDDYNSLRDFFAYIVKKQNEQIVFKKKK